MNKIIMIIILLMILVVEDSIFKKNGLFGRQDVVVFQLLWKC